MRATDSRRLPSCRASSSGKVRDINIYIDVPVSDEIAVRPWKWGRVTAYASLERLGRYQWKNVVWHSLGRSVIIAAGLPWQPPAGQPTRSVKAHVDHSEPFGWQGRV